MNINPFDPSTNMEEIKRMLAGNDNFYHELFNAVSSSSEGLYISQTDNALTGFLSLNRFNKRRITPYVYVDPSYRRRGIGSQLLRFSDRIITDSEYEHAYYEFTEDKRIADFLSKNDYRSFCSKYEMERDNVLIDSKKTSDEALHERGILIRNYTDDDYLAWHNICHTSFFLMREKLGLTPSYYNPPSVSERNQFASEPLNRFVMLVDGVTVAICEAPDNEVRLLAVRPDLQSRGYGRIMLSYLINMMLQKRNARLIKIAVLDGNPAKRLYDRLSFHTVRYCCNYIKYYKPDSRQSSPKGYTSEEAILNEFRLHGMLREDMEA